MNKFLKFIGLILEFLVILIVSAMVYPYLFFSENYIDTKIEVNDYFPIAIIENNKAQIVKWRDYNKNPKSYTLLLDTKKTSYKLEEYTGFTIEKTKDNLYKVTHDDDNYVFWGNYTVKNNTVIPNDFRMDGAFMSLPVFPFSIFFILIFNRIIKMIYRNRKLNKRINER